MSATIDRALPISITLSAEQWQIVMQLLSIVHAPYTVVHPLITQIQAQCMRHAALPTPHAAPPLPEHMPARVSDAPNGEDHTAA